MTNSYARCHFLTLALSALALAAAMATADAGDAPADADRYAKIVVDPVRTDQDRKMDASRHPVASSCRSRRRSPA